MPPGQDSWLFIATGKKSNQTVEIIDLEDNSEMTCTFSLPNMPLELHGAVGYLHDEDSPMICGGFSDQVTSYRPECYRLNNLQSWASATGILL